MKQASPRSATGQPSMLTAPVTNTTRRTRAVDNNSYSRSEFSDGKVAIAASTAYTTLHGNSTRCPSAASCELSRDDGRGSAPLRIRLWHCTAPSIRRVHGICSLSSPSSWNRRTRVPVSARAAHAAQAGPGSPSKKCRLTMLARDSARYLRRSPHHGILFDGCLVIRISGQRHLPVQDRPRLRHVVRAQPPAEDGRVLHGNLRRGVLPLALLRGPPGQLVVAKVQRRHGQPRQQRPAVAVGEVRIGPLEQKVGHGVQVVRVVQVLGALDGPRHVVRGAVQGELEDARETRKSRRERSVWACAENENLSAVGTSSAVRVHTGRFSVLPTKVPALTCERACECSAYRDSPAWSRFSTRFRSP